MLTAWGEGYARELTIEDFRPQEGSIRVIEAFELDNFTQMQGHTLDDFRPNLRQLPLNDIPINYLSPESLITLKNDSWREKDKLDVQAMREVIAREKQQSP